MVADDDIARARATRIESELVRRRIKLRRTGAELVGPCPTCAGHDRFAVNVKKQVWNCRGSGEGGDVICMVQLIDGVDFPAAVQTLTGDRPAVETRQPPGRPTTTAAKVEVEDNRERALLIWVEARPIAGTLAETYLARRGLSFPDPDGRVLRFDPECPFGPGVVYPCLLALHRCIHTDKPMAITRTAILHDGIKVGRKSLGRRHRGQADGRRGRDIRVARR